jgi:hypothetical protein
MAAIAALVGRKTVPTKAGDDSSADSGVASRLALRVDSSGSCFTASVTEV